MFSVREQKIIKIVGRKKLTFEEIASELFKNAENVPFETNITVGNSVRRIIKKCSHHKLDWTLTKNRVNSKLLISKEILR